MQNRSGDKCLVKGALVRNLTQLIIFCAVTALLYLGVRWAVLPAYWSGSWIGGTNETMLETAKDHFGPILLQNYWINDPHKTWGKKDDVLKEWGHLEATYRLVLIIIIIWAVFSINFWRKGCSR